MKVERNQKTYEIDDEWIDKTVETLEISINEAVEMWLCDNDIETNPEVDEMTKRAKTINRYTRSAAENKKTTRERKKDALKQKIIQAVIGGLEQLSEIEDLTLRNDEKYVDLTINGEEYTINLVKHRKKK
jgi:hypothetical protein